MNKAIFLDRDGVINENIYEVDGQIVSPSNLEQLKVLPHVKEGIFNLSKMGFKVVVITNQPGIAFGYLKQKNLSEINQYLINLLGIDKIYFCPHHPKFNGECLCRKPKIGLIERAKEELNIDISKSYLAGDSLSDIETGKNAKVKKTFLIGEDRIDVRNIMDKKNIFPDFIVKDLVELAKKIEQIEN